MLQINTPDSENENAKKYNIEMNKGKKGRLANLYRFIERRREDCNKGDMSFCPIKIVFA